LHSGRSPQQAPLWWIATARSLILNRGIVIDIMPGTTPEPGWCAVHSDVHSIKAVVSQVGALQTDLQACGD